MVRTRARNRCEYCRLPQEYQEATFHVDHVWPRKKGGMTAADNLALACVCCSLRKGARVTAWDPVAKAVVPLFNPRAQKWPDHFSLARGPRIRGKTPVGRATIFALAMNRPSVLAIRVTPVALGVLHFE